MSKRKSFVIHIDSLDILDDLTDEQAGQLFRAIKSHQKGENVELNSVVKIAFSPFKNQFQRDDEKYEKLCEKNRLIAENRYSTKSTTGESGNQNKPDVTKSTDNDSKSDSDNNSDSKSKISSRFTPPTIQEIYAYLVEKNFDSLKEAENIFYFYDSKGWLVGKSKMKNWKSAVSRWISDKTPPPKKQQPAVQQPFDRQAQQDKEMQELMEKFR